MLLLRLLFSIIHSVVFFIFLVYHFVCCIFPAVVVFSVCAPWWRLTVKKQKDYLLTYLLHAATVNNLFSNRRPLDRQSHTVTFTSWRLLSLLLGS